MSTDYFTKKEMGGIVSKGEIRAAAKPTEPPAGTAIKRRSPMKRPSYFRMPLHYPSYTRADYEGMPEWKVDLLLAEYGLPVMGSLEEKRKFAMGAFLWS